MPNNVVKSIADKADISIEKAEEYWDKAKEEVKDEYDDVDEGSDQFYKLVTSIAQNMAGVKEGNKMTEFEKKLNETRDNRQKVSTKKNKKHYSGTDNNLSDYNTKTNKPSDYRSRDDWDNINKSDKRRYNAAKDDKSSDYDDYEGGRESEDERTDKDTKQGYTPHKEREKYYGKSYSHDDLEDLTKDVDVSHETSERKQYSKTRKRYESTDNVSFEDVLKENKQKLDELDFSSSFDGKGVYDDSEIFDGAGFYIVDTRTDSLVAGPYMNQGDAGLAQSQFDEEGGYLTVELDEEGERIY